MDCHIHQYFITYFCKKNANIALLLHWIKWNENIIVWYCFSCKIISILGQCTVPAIKTSSKNDVTNIMIYFDPLPLSRFWVLWLMNCSSKYFTLPLRAWRLIWTDPYGVDSGMSRMWALSPVFYVTAIR